LSSHDRRSGAQTRPGVGTSSGAVRNGRQGADGHGRCDGQDAAATARADGPRRLFGSAVSIGGLAALALGGWLAEVARIQAVEEHFGLPLTTTADPRAAAAFTALPLAVALALNSALLIALVLVARRHVWAGAALAAAAAAALVGPLTWQAVLLRVAAVLVALAALYAVRGKAVALLEGAARRVRRRAPRPGASDWDGELRTAAVGFAASAAVAVLLFAPLELGEQAGRRQAADRDVFFVVAKFACDRDVAVVALGRDGDGRTVRVADRGDDGRWRLRPGLLSVPAQDPLVEVRLGRIAPSRPGGHPQPVPALPPACPPGGP